MSINETMFGIAPEYYSPIYNIVVAVLSILVFSQYANRSDDRLEDVPDQPSLGVALFTVLMIIFIGLRPVSEKYFVDMATYDAAYGVLKGHDFVYYGGPGTNLLFDSLFGFLASKDVPVTYFFFIIAAIYFIGISLACCMLFPKDKMASVLVYLSAFSTFAYGTNGIKAGAAAAFFLVAVALYERRQWVWVVILLLVSYGFHHAMIMPIVAFVACLVVKNPKVYLIFWVVCFFISLFHITFFQELMANFIDEQGAGYLLGDGGYVKADFLGGFRIDFILYSVIPIIVGIIAVEQKKIQSDTYLFLLNLYTLTNAVWLLCMYADFTNRIAYLSWMLFPIVLIYPFLNEEWEGPRYKIFQWVVYGHLVFNLFMAFIYW